MQANACVAQAGLSVHGDLNCGIQLTDIEGSRQSKDLKPTASDYRSIGKGRERGRLGDRRGREEA